MQIKVNEQGYISEYAVVGSLVGGTEIPDPSDIAHFERHFASYRIRDGTLLFDKEHYNELMSEATKDEYRRQREKECFLVINRGKLWYDTLSEEQQLELETWYRAWLDGTETNTVPDKPAWLV